MTSQLILGNGHGLAIASDSAATYGTRTYEDAQKVRGLKHPHNVAVLQSGGVDLFGMPVSVLLEEWNKTLGDDRMPLEAYRDTFLSWLGHNLSKWTGKVEMDRRVGDALNAELRQIRAGEIEVLRGGVEEVLEKGVEGVLADLPSVWGEEHQDAVLRVIKERSEWVHSRSVYDPALPPMADGLFSRLESRNQEDSWTPQSLIDSCFEGLPRSEQIDLALHEHFRLMVGRSYWITGHHITLTFAGYGLGDLTPTVASVSIRGAMESHIARSDESVMRARQVEAGFALYKPVAQNRTIELIISGHNPDLMARAMHLELGPAPVLPVDAAEAKGNPGVAVEEAPDRDLAEDTTERDAIEQWTELRQLGERFLERADSLSTSHHYWTFMETIARLEMPSLTDTTRSLIAVEALGKDLRGAQPTVGGHIDVATITLRDGFTWVSDQ